jgi:hypothetical protein
MALAVALALAMALAMALALALAMTLGMAMRQPHSLPPRSLPPPPPYTVPRTLRHRHRPLDTSVRTVDRGEVELHRTGRRLARTPAHGIAVFTVRTTRVTAPSGSSGPISKSATTRAISHPVHTNMGMESESVSTRVWGMGDPIRRAEIWGWKVNRYRYGYGLDV